MFGYIGRCILGAVCTAQPIGAELNGGRDSSNQIAAPALPDRVRLNTRPALIPDSVVRQAEPWRKSGTIGLATYAISAKLSTRNAIWISKPNDCR